MPVVRIVRAAEGEGLPAVWAEDAAGAELAMLEAIEIDGNGSDFVGAIIVEAISRPGQVYLAIRSLHDDDDSAYLSPQTARRIAARLLDVADLAEHAGWQGAVPLPPPAIGIEEG